MRLIHRTKADKGKRFGRSRPVIAALAISAFMPLLAKAGPRTVKPLPNVQVVKLDKEGIERYLTSPVDIDKKGKATAIRIAVPVLRGEPGTYIVIEIKGKELKELLDRAAALPEREQVIVDEVRAYQRAMWAWGAKAKKATRPPVDSVRPLHPRLAGGKGTKAAPFVLEIPVPVKEEGLAGATLYSDESKPHRIGVKELNVFYACRFVGKESGPAPRITTMDQLSLLLTRILKKRINQYLRNEKGLPFDQVRKITFHNALNSSITAVLRNVQNQHPAITSYFSH